MPSVREHLTNESVERLALTENGQYRVLDDEIPGFWVVVGATAKTYTAQAAVNGRTVRKALGRHGAITAREARRLAREWLGQAAAGEVIGKSRLTLRQTWARFREHLLAKGRSPRTLEAYEWAWRHVGDWLDTPLARLADDPDLVAQRHQAITARRGPVAANRVMRAVRSVYRFAHKRRLDRGLPSEHPCAAVDWNTERRRDTALTLETAPKWYEQLRGYENAVRREFHWFTLLSGARPGSLKRAKWEHLDVRRRVLHFPDPKGGPSHAFDLPLSREMLRSLARVRRAGRSKYPDPAAVWIFPAATPTGHIAEHKENRSVLSHWGGDLRQTWRTVAVAAGIGEMEAHLLLNHRLRGVSAGYITRSALLPHLVQVQERVSAEIRRWVGSGVVPRAVEDASGGGAASATASKGWRQPKLDSPQVGHRELSGSPRAPSDSARRRATAAPAGEMPV